MEGKQQSALDTALQGHNLLILGQSGTGKSFVIKNISRGNTDHGKKVNITGTTGVAALNVGGVTVHSWGGLGDGRFSNKELVDKLNTDEHFLKYKNNIVSTDCLIIDEISMLSAKSFEQLEYVCRKIRGSDIYFGGIQVIGSGDFFQLPPVPDPFKQDPGDFCFSSKIFKSVFPHKTVLEKIVRQDELDLIKAISDVSKGILPEDTCSLLNRLQRNLPPGEPPVKLFSRNFDREIYNASCLMEAEGEIHTYEALDSGLGRHLNKLAVSKTLHIKLNSPVMLVKNLSATLVNGSKGVVVDTGKDTITVKFSSVTAELKRETFSVYSCVDNKVIASRTQIPVVLAYGMTIHKAQGLTLDRVIVDCSNIFKAGQLGVAIGRAKKKKGLQLVNFKPNTVIKPSETIFQFYNEESLPLCDINDCCKIPHTVIEEFDRDMDITDHDVDVRESDTDTLRHESDRDTSEFSSDIDEELAMLSEINEPTHDHSSIDQEPDCPISVEDIKSNCVPEQSVTPEQVIITDRMNFLIRHQATNLRVYLRKLYLKLTDLCKSHCLVGENVKTDSKVWTKYYTELYQFSNSEEYRVFIKDCIQKTPDETDYTVFSRIFDHVSLFVLQETNKQSAHQIPNSSESTHKSQPDSALGKLRYIGGRCVAKSKYHLMKVSRANLYNKSKTELVRHCYRKVRLLDSVTCTDSTENTKFEHSIEEIRRKQNLRGGLTNINDQLMMFFDAVNTCRCKVENEQTFHTEGSNTLNFVRDHVLRDENLFKLFIELFANEDFSQMDDTLIERLLKELFEDLVIRFCQVAGNQFRKDMLRSLGISKSEALRKKVLGKQKKEDKRKKWSMSSIYNDSSECKISSHLKLKSRVCDDGAVALENFTKKELLVLCKAYSVSMSNNTNKKNICEKLVSVIMTMNFVPNVKYLSVDNEEQSHHEEQPSTSAQSISVDNEEQSHHEEQPSTSATQSPRFPGRKRKTKKSSLTTKRKKKKPKSVEKTLCVKCGYRYGEDDDWIQCDLGDKWFDRHCQNIDEETFVRLREEEDDWYCIDCCN